MPVGLEEAWESFAAENYSDQNNHKSSFIIQVSAHP